MAEPHANKFQLMGLSTITVTALCSHMCSFSLDLQVIPAWCFSLPGQSGTGLYWADPSRCSPPCQCAEC